MTEIPFHTPLSLTATARDHLRSAVRSVFESEPVTFRKSEPGPGVLSFGGSVGIHTLSNAQIHTYPFPERYLALALARVQNCGPVPLNTPWGIDAEDVLFADIESHNVEKRWAMPPRDFFRMGQWAWGPAGDVYTTTDYDEFMAVLNRARYIVIHNGHPFDLSVSYGVDSTIPLGLARENRVFDTMVYANLTAPAPLRFVDRSGAVRVTAIKGSMKPEMVMKWLSLDNLCYQLGLEGKEGNLRDLAKKYNPHGTLVADLDYGLIPTDDPDFVAYAIQDVKALQELTCALLVMKPVDDYDWREQLNAAIDAQNSRNGFRVDIPAAQRRADFLTARKDEILAELQGKYGMPVEGKMPWRTNPGKDAIFTALADFGLTEDTVPDWPLTDTGNRSLGGPALLEVTSDTPAFELGQALAELMGQRSLSRLALASTQPDGMVHPEITALQRSGRKSTTKPGLTVWTSRGPGAVEKEYFIPDGPDHHLYGFDYSQADARITAAYSGDQDFKKRFAEGVDAHELTGRLVFGNDTYDSDPEKYRHIAKNMGHAYGYRAGWKKLAMMAKQPHSVAQRFVDRMQDAYPDLTVWQDKVTAEGERGFIVNDWGRKIVVESDRSYTQAPAMYGQSGTRELMVDALIRMLDYNIRLILWLKAQIHDELIFSIPDTEAAWAVPKIKELMEVEWGPCDGSGQVVRFPVGVSEPATNWFECGH